jgi:hypothetical protein
VDGARPICAVGLGFGEMTQARRHSALETVTSTGLGFVVSWLATPPIMALFDVHTSHTQAAGITAIYTALSLVRGYIVRRAYNHMAH